MEAEDVGKAILVPPGLARYRLGRVYIWTSDRRMKEFAHGSNVAMLTTKPVSRKRLTTMKPTVEPFRRDGTNTQ